MAELSRLFVTLSLLACTACSGDDGKRGPSGTDGSEGPEGPEGPSGTGTASISSVVPASAFLQRTATVTISGSGTEWTAAAMPDFGAGVNVDSVVLASPTALVVDITIERDAATGARDVTVTEGSDELVYAGAFRIASPLDVSVAGNAAQGSASVITLKNLDVLTPLDTTSTGGGLFDPTITFTNVAVTTGPGTLAQVSNVRPFGADFVMLVDVDTAAGPQDIDLTSGPPGAEDEFFAPGGVDIAARTAEDLTVGTATTGMVAAPYESYLFKYTPSGSGVKVITLSAGTTEPTASPGAIVLPASGKFADLIGFGPSITVVAEANDPYYMLFWDNSGVASYTYTLVAESLTVAAADEAEPNDVIADALVATSLPFVMTNASLSGTADEDLIEIDAAAGELGKVIHVRTYGTDSLTDVVVDVLAPDGTTSLGGPSGDQGYHEDFTSTPIMAAGKHYVKVLASGFFDSAHSEYGAIVTLE